MGGRGTGAKEFALLIITNKSALRLEFVVQSWLERTFSRSRRQMRDPGPRLGTPCELPFVG